MRVQTDDHGGFSSEELGLLKKCFEDFDPEGTGFVVCDDLPRLVELAGVPTSEAMVAQVLASIEADAASQFTFAEFCDIAAVLAERH